MPYFLLSRVQRDFYLWGLGMQISDNGLNKLKQMEGAVKIDGRHVIYDDATGRPITTNAPLPIFDILPNSVYTPNVYIPFVMAAAGQTV